MAPTFPVSLLGSSQRTEGHQVKLLAAVAQTYIRILDILSLKLQTRRVSSTEPAKCEGSNHDLCDMGVVEHRAHFVPL